MFGPYVADPPMGVCGGNVCSVCATQYAPGFRWSLQCWWWWGVCHCGKRAAARRGCGSVDQALSLPSPADAPADAESAQGFKYIPDQHIFNIFPSIPVIELE